MTTINTQIAQAKANLAKLEEAQRQANQLEAQKQQLLSQVDQQAQIQAELQANLNTVITETKPKLAEERELASLISKLTAQVQEIQKLIAQKQMELQNLRQDIQIGLAGALLPIVRNEVRRTAPNDSIGDISHAHTVQHEVSNRVRKVLKNITEELA